MVIIYHNEHKESCIIMSESGDPINIEQCLDRIERMQTDSAVLPEYD